MMNNEEQNIFYSSISPYYASIFPFNPDQFRFIQEEAGNLTGIKILDVGCATGELAKKLAEEAAQVVGVDLNEELLHQAKSINAKGNLQFRKGDMLLLKEYFSKESFHVVLCFGNTLVHLNEEVLILQMLKDVYSILKPGGKFLLQILNYDYIIEEQVPELPLIENEYLIFTRCYSYSKLPLILFKTKLELKGGGKTIINETMLLALRSQRLKILLHDSGFSEVVFYSGFKKVGFGGSHLPLVVSCLKN